MEQSILTKIRRLLPVAVDGDGAIAALRRIDEFLSTFEARDCSSESHHDCFDDTTLLIMLFLCYF